MKTISLNARSIRHKVEFVMSYLVDNFIDIIFIQESWLRKCDQAIVKEIKEYGFDVMSYRKSVKLDFGCGVATIFKRNLQVKQL